MSTVITTTNDDDRNHPENNDNTLPFHNYHRAAYVGSGSYGSVVVVYNDDGEQYAMKLFEPDEEEEEEYEEEDVYDDDDDDEQQPPWRRKCPLSLGALREISILRLLRYQHPNIIPMVDIQPEWTDDEEDGGGGAGTSYCLGMALPLYTAGSLADAIEHNVFLEYPKAKKIQFVHDICSAIVFLHDHGIIHRDMKSDNILLQYHNERNLWQAILIDFSLAKPIQQTMWQNDPQHDKEEEDILASIEQHTGEVGTVIYTAPEIIQQEWYDLKSDIYSLGVVLLELCTNRCLVAQKHKEAVREIQQRLQTLPLLQPFPQLIETMVRYESTERPTARQVISHPLFTEKFHIPIPEFRYMNLSRILPYNDDHGPSSLADGEENEPPSNNKIVNRSQQQHNNKQNNTKLPQHKNNNQRKKKMMEKRKKRIESICHELDSHHPLTKPSAYEYSILLAQINGDDDLDDDVNSQSLFDCCLLAHRFHECDMINLRYLPRSDCRTHPNDWSIEQYIDNESTIFMLMDYCLYPRMLSHLP